MPDIPDFEAQKQELDYSSKVPDAHDFSLHLANFLGDSDAYIDTALNAEKEKQKGREARAGTIQDILSGKAINDVNEQIVGLNQQISDKLNSIGTYHDPEKGKTDIWETIGSVIAGVADPQHRGYYAGLPVALRDQRHQEDVALARQNYEDQLLQTKMQVGGLQQQITGLQDQKGDLVGQQTRLFQNRETSMRAANASLTAKIGATKPDMQAIRVAAEEVKRLAAEYGLDPEYAANIDSMVETSLREGEQRVAEAAQSSLITEAGKLLTPILSQLRGKTPDDQTIASLATGMHDVLANVAKTHGLAPGDPAFDGIVGSLVQTLVSAIDLPSDAKELAIKRLQQQGDQFSQRMALEWAKAKVSAVSPRGKNDTGAQSRGAIIDEAQRGVEPGSMTTPVVSAPGVNPIVSRQAGVGSSMNWQPDVLKYMGAAVGTELRARKSNVKISAAEFHKIIGQLELERGHPLQISDENHAKQVAKIVVDYLLAKSKKK